MINLDEKKFCFCTYAGGEIYSSLAANLVSDIEKYAPETPLIIFTDKPNKFSNHSNSNVLVFPHQRRGVLHYHERRFAIAKALSMFNSCMYLDADVRICAPFPENKLWLPGITARSCTSMMKHIQELMSVRNSASGKMAKQVEFYKTMGKKLGIDIETQDLTWINEFLFVVTRDSGREVEFLKLWEKLAVYAELNGHHKHPAYAIGIAATKASFPIRHDVMEGVDFFDDRIEKVRISKEESDPNVKNFYFEFQNQIEQPQRSILQKVWSKICKNAEYLYYAVRLKVYAFSDDYKFYYQ
ncbi:hypothetical protein [Calothrix sp. UHCC 0171]|uniref:hypothetical protein n=1 Tax=Calothrix sp. UHCC 0171 TaxID=3110245 RepID=UPI002B1EF7FA|nr:hypothetical protein [Calothrix sp. UHCC 0171]MEA5571672.1 hypothetical protein [Calothrix sp. UHCC 0171]